MSNEWNRFFDNVFNAGAKVTGAGFEKSAQYDALETYNMAMKNVKEAALKLSTQTQQQTEANNTDGSAPLTTEYKNPIDEVMKGYDENKSLTEQNIEPVTTPDVSGEIQKIFNPGTTTPNPLLNKGGDQKQDGSTLPVTPETAFDVFFKGITDLMNKGEYGKQYIPMLETYYKGSMPTAPKYTKEISNGYLILSDENGNIIKKTKIDDMPKEEKNTVEKYSKMTFEDAVKLTDNELSGDAFFYLPQEVQTKLMETYPALQQLHDAKFKEGDFSKSFSSGSNRKFGAPKINFGDKTLETRGKELYEISKQIDGMGGYEKLKNEGSELVTKHDELVNYLQANGVNDWIQFREDMANDVKIKDAKQNQQVFADDYNTIVQSANVYGVLDKLWNLDSSQPDQAAQIQQLADGLYKWLGDNIYRKVDYPMEKAIYDYVNSEIDKLWKSKFGGG